MAYHQLVLLHLNSPVFPAPILNIILELLPLSTLCLVLLLLYIGVPTRAWYFNVLTKAISANQ